MPGIFEQGEKEANQTIKDVAIFVASCYFPVANINMALKAKSYFSLAWNSLLLTKEMSDFMLGMAYQKIKKQNCAKIFRNFTTN